MEQKITRKKKPKTTLDKIFTELSDVTSYKDFVKIRIGKITLGNSVIRVFIEGTKEQLAMSLSTVRLDKLEYIQSQPEYDRWPISRWTRFITAYAVLKQTLLS